MYERIGNCPICGSDQFTNLMICQDYTVTQESFAIVECKKCRFKLTNPRPTQENAGRYYQSEAYISHSNTTRGIVNQLYHFARKFTLQKKLKLINSLGSEKKRLLDVGCGTGTFLEVCQKSGWNVNGTEPDAKARGLAHTRVKSQVEENLLSAFPGETFETITLWHVLEHIHQLDESVKKLKKLLTSNGTLLVAVPNCESYDAKLYREKWAAYDVPRHLYHFSPDTVRALFLKHRLIIQKIIPMELDAYYISLLSSRYRDGKTDYWQAFRNGRASNQWAEENGNNYSSLIYLIKSKA
ncbi:MAG: class I SAM-dependent methyltransferase [Ferruginibacter sp.]|nr:class I SAM-dependent methyltransferase [Cytophagales bacterium]